MVQEIEELGPEFKVCVFRSAEFLKDGEIQIVVSRTVHLVPRRSQRTEIGLSDGGCRGGLNEGLCV